MGNGRGIKRKVNSQIRKEDPIQKLAFLLGNFYDFLRQVDKPTDEQVREAFIQSEQEWIGFCKVRHLGDEYRKLFNLNVGEMWKRNAQQP